MNRKTLLWIIGVIAVIFIAGAFYQKSAPLFAISGQETMTRTASKTTVNPNEQFTITYTAQGTSGSWGATIQDSVSGGCQFPAGTTYRDIWISDEGNTRTVTVTTPSSGSCTFSGDYKFGNFSIKTFSSLSISICQKATCISLNKQCGSWSDNCGGTLSCGTCQYGSCDSTGKCVCNPICTRPLDLCIESSTISNNCGGTCTGSWTVTRNTPADINCDNQVSRTELRDYGLKWINAQISRDELGTAIQAWSST